MNDQSSSSQLANGSDRKSGLKTLIVVVRGTERGYLTGNWKWFRLIALV